MHPPILGPQQGCPRPERPQMKQESVKAQPGDLSRRMLQTCGRQNSSQRSHSPDRPTDLLFRHVMCSAVSRLAEISGERGGEPTAPMLCHCALRRLGACLYYSTGVRHARHKSEHMLDNFEVSASTSLSLSTDLPRVAGRPFPYHRGTS
jgi:hypothetical protein